MLREINFDGIVGPSHNYAGLSFGNLAAMSHAGAVAHPRLAALQGIAKMRANLGLGLPQGIFLPHRRPAEAWLASLGADLDSAEDWLRASALSASAMWAANAATVSPAPDTADGRCHLTPANLLSMPHRSHEWPGTLAQLRLAFADREHFVIHDPVPPPFGDEGAANHMRVSAAHAEPGVEVFVYGESGTAFPARQHRAASEAVARLHQLDPGCTIFARQSDAAIAAGAFHNDVLAVANEQVLLVHEQAFASPRNLYDELRLRRPSVEIVEVSTDDLPLDEAISSYLFNSQLVTLAAGEMALIIPREARDQPRAWRCLETIVKGNGPIRHIEVVDVTQSMANGGGPACLRLRVVADPGTIDPRFLVDHARLDRIEDIVRGAWPEAIAPDDLGSRAMWSAVGAARAKLLEALDLAELI